MKKRERLFVRNKSMASFKQGYDVGIREGRQKLQAEICALLGMYEKFELLR